MLRPNETLTSEDGTEYAVVNYVADMDGSMEVQLVRKLGVEDVSKVLRREWGIDFSPVSLNQIKEGVEACQDVEQALRIAYVVANLYKEGFTFGMGIPALFNYAARGKFSFDPNDRHHT